MRGCAETPSCRRQYLLGYFGEQLDAPCGRCDVCERVADEPGAVDAGRADTSPPAGGRGRTSRTSVCSTRIGVRAPSCTWRRTASSCCSEGGAAVAVAGLDSRLETAHGIRKRQGLGGLRRRGSGERHEGDAKGGQAAHQGSDRAPVIAAPRGRRPRFRPRTAQTAGIGVPEASSAPAGQTAGVRHCSNGGTARGDVGARPVPASGVPPPAAAVAGDVDADLHHQLRLRLRLRLRLHEGHVQRLVGSPPGGFPVKSCVLRLGSVSQCGEDRAASRSDWCHGLRADEVRERGVGRDHSCELPCGWWCWRRLCLVGYVADMTTGTASRHTRIGDPVPF
ncbi:RecQ family zinc-binding domain-containing protein [Streptomyces sp. MAD19A]|uniref:RecQ family zinc-binding domain-containing protein n=1 Tax=Streptomyces sp. MAD19A TaxID=3242896 RepID=UPI0035284C19